jgi:hypothetical protein
MAKISSSLSSENIARFVCDSRPLFCRISRTSKEARRSGIYAYRKQDEKGRSDVEIGLIFDTGVKILDQVGLGVSLTTLNHTCQFKAT